MNAAQQSIEPGFYVIGGTLQRDAPSYVTRRADSDLYEGLRQGRFCYVLTARQMGKSSLMIRTALRLREEGVAVAVLDLTAVGQNLTVEQWYAGLLNQIGQQLDLEDECFDFWEEHADFGPLQRWLRALGEVVLARYVGRVVIFIDEIDAIRNLPFSTDEFFAGIREFYNRRAEDADLCRLTFCLLGVATPSDLIRDTRTTPFNVGQRIELADFSETEAAPLAQGLNCAAPQAARLLNQILYWTGGHPYLTQRLCLAVTKASVDAAPTPQLVNRLCAELFLSARARELDDNLLFVRERLLRSEADRASLLDLYAQVLSRQRVRDDETNPLVSVLRLAGITRAEAGELKVRNRIYGQVFDRQWITANMPDAELQRQRAAYRRGLLRATLAATAVLLVVVALAVAAIRGRQQAVEQRQIAEQEKLKAEQERNRAKEAAERADRIANQLQISLDETRHQRQLAETQGLSNRRLLYAAQMNLAQRAWETDNIARVLELLAQQQTDLRGFEWDYLWRLCHNARLSIRLPTNFVSIKLAPDGKTAAIALPDQSVRLWDLIAKRERLRLQGRVKAIKAIAFSADGKRVATGSEEGALRLWETASGKESSPAQRASTAITTIAFAPDGKHVAVGGEDGALLLWEPASKKGLAILGEHTHPVTTIAFAPNGKWLASGSEDNSAKLWNLAERKEQHSLAGHTDVVTAVAFSGDSQHLVTGSQDGTARVWNVARGQERLPRKQAGAVTAIAFAPASNLFATASSDNHVKLWGLDAAQTQLIRRGHTAPVVDLAFSRDGSELVTGSQDHTIKLWDVTSAPDPLAGSLAGKNDSIALSPDGRWLATAGAERTPQLWDAATGKLLGTLTGEGHSDAVTAVVFSPNGKWLATGSNDGTVRLWDARARRSLTTLPQSSSVNALAFAPDSQLLAIGNDDWTIKLWDLTRNREAATFKVTDATITCVAFAPTGGYLAAGGDDGIARLWDVARRQQIAQLKGHRHAITSIVFAPDNRQLMTGSLDGTARLWDWPGGASSAVFGEGADAITAVAFTPDGKRLVAGRADGSVRLWDLATRQEVYTFKEHSGRISALAFSADGKRLATASWDKTWLLFRAATDEEILAERR